MKGLDEEELEAMACVAAGFSPLSGRWRPSGAIGRLLKRGLLVEATVSCGAYDCVGHRGFTMTSVGVMVWNAVKCGG